MHYFGVYTSLMEIRRLPMLEMEPERSGFAEASIAGLEGRHTCQFFNVTSCSFESIASESGAGTF